MGRPTAKRRLRDIDPDDFGRHVAERVEAHVSFLLDPLDQDTEVARVVERNVAEVAKAASLLAQYARDGAADPEPAINALFAVRVWLYSCAAHPPHARLEKLDVDPDGDIGIVLLAAHARVRLRQSEGVPVRELACLAGVDPDHVRLLARQGQMALISGGVVAPQIAKQWLEARGVALPSLSTAPRPSVIAHRHGVPKT